LTSAGNHLLTSRMVYETGNLAVHVSTFLAWTGGVAAITWFICTRYMGSSKNASDDYFAGGRSLKWYVIAGSLMLTNLSTEQLVGLNGVVFQDGCLVGIWWEAGAAIAMIVTATLFLPRYLILGLTTTSGFLGERYCLLMRTLVSVIFLFYYAVVLCPLVLYTGALAIRDIFEVTVPLWVISSLIGALGATYALFGGLKAVAVSDCLNGLGLILIGLWVPISCLQLLPNGLSSVFEESAHLKVLAETSMIYDNTKMVRAGGIPSVPWHVTFTGLFVTNMYYWSTNQVIVQRVLAAESLANAQKGVLFAACMKVVGFSFLCMPGILGLIMSKHGVMVDGEVFQVTKSDEVYPLLVKAVMPTWSLGLFSAVLLGSVLSTFNSALNSASTMFGLEIYKVYINKEATDQMVVKVATIFGASLTLLSFLIAPFLEHVDSIFSFLQHMNTVVSLPIVTIFFAGIAASLPDAFSAKVGFVVAMVACGISQFLDSPHYLHRFFISFLIAVAAIALATYVPFVRKVFGQEPVPAAYVEATDKALVDMKPWKYTYHIVVIILVLLTLLLIALQTASQWLFCVFGGLWVVSIVTLMSLSANAGHSECTEKQAKESSTSQDVEQNFSKPTLMVGSVEVDLKSTAAGNVS